MNKIYLTILLSFMAINVFARQPAIDRTVSIEPVPEKTLKRAITIDHQFNAYKLNNTPNSATDNNSIFVYFVLVAFISLPMVSWFIIERSSKTQAVKTRPLENISNLSEVQNESKDDHDDINKAS